MTAKTKPPKGGDRGKRHGLMIRWPHWKRLSVLAGEAYMSRPAVIEKLIDAAWTGSGRKL